MGAFFCETCDRGLKTEEKLQEHIAQHQVCGREGCTFTAHPKVVSKHIQIQHESGLFSRINSEDAAKWIAERKSRFPTKENVAKKEAQLNEMVKRGERIPSHEKRFQNNSTHRNWRDQRKQRNENSNKLDVVSKKPKLNHKPTTFRKPYESSQWRDPDAWRGDLPKFPGTAAFPPVVDSQEKDEKLEENFSDDDEWTKSGDNGNAVSQKPIVSNILTSLMANYGSDMSDEDGEIDIVSQKIETHTPVHVRDEPVKEVIVNDQGNELPSELPDDSDSGPDEVVIEHEDKSNIPVLKGKESKEQIHSQGTDVDLKKDENKNGSKIAHVKVPMKRQQLSLLEKLLKNEIIHERNVILQCVRYVVKNNFIGCGNLAPFHSVER